MDIGRLIGIIIVYAVYFGLIALLFYKSINCDTKHDPAMDMVLFSVLLLFVVFAFGFVNHIFDEDFRAFMFWILFILFISLCFIH